MTKITVKEEQEWQRQQEKEDQEWRKTKAKRGIKTNLRPLTKSEILRQIIDYEDK